nr:putative transposase [Ipomoea batatas]
MDLLSSSCYVSLLLAVFHTLQKKMSMLYVLAKDISPQSYKKAIRLRLIRTYTVTEGRNKSAVKSQECVFHDIEEGYYYVPGTIVSIESGKKWFYNSCRKSGCFKSLTLTETYYFCDTCKTNWAEGNVRYKVIVRVLDKTSDAPFVLWDKDCFELLGITAYDLKTKYSMAKMQVPIEFEQLRNKSMVFRINLKNEHIRNLAKPISVLSVSHNEELEAQYCPSMLDDQDELSRMIEEDADDLESDDSESGDEAISPIVQANLKLKGVANDQDEVDTCAIKRCLLDQFSSSQNLKKCRPLVIKEEKTL